jgi:nitrogen fixation/metabolism regulation signal transduction histidine kinase
MSGKGSKKQTEDEALRRLKHDIKNQLSNIHLALEQLRHELPSVSSDCIFYMDTIAMSSNKINSLLKDKD